MFLTPKFKENRNKFSFLLIVFIISLFNSLTISAEEIIEFNNSGKIESGDSESIVFIESNLEDKDLIRKSILNNHEIYSKFKKESPVQLHIFSHAKEGMLFINGKWLNRIEILKWFNTLLIDKSKLKSLIFYGCNFAKGIKGRKTIDFLEKKLNVSVAASTNITGKGGDWKMEVGSIYNTIIINDYK